MMLQRRRAKESSIEYARYIQIPGVPADENAPDAPYDVVETPLAIHHKLILQTCQDLVEDNLRYNVDTMQPDDSGRVCRNLMLALPPGSAKSTYASVVFPTWVMGHNPHYEVILTGYGETIVKKHGKRARQICASPAYCSVFGINVDPTTRAADNWGTPNGSTYKAAGILSGITGFRCNLLIWDDLVKGRKEADSVTIQEDTYNAYIDDARSRKKPKAHEIGINTRWSEQDIMGRILPDGYAGENGFIECQDGNVWRVICIPAQCERDDDPLGREIGEYIWEDWFNIEYWDDKRINPRSWASLYQQRPSLESGLFYQREWMRTYHTPPEHMDKYISFDPAVTESEDADDTAMHVWGIDDQAKIYLLDEWVGKVTMDKWIGTLCTWIAIHKPLMVVSESGVIRRAAEPYIKREMQQTGHYALFEWVSRNADKSAMSRAAQAMVAAGNVFFPDNSIGDAMVDELLRFPAGKDDHRCDSLANLMLYLESLWAHTPPKIKKDDRGELTHGFKIRQIMPKRNSKRKSRWT